VIDGKFAPCFIISLHNVERFVISDRFNDRRF
jgi:hypothetical protein